MRSSLNRRSTQFLGSCSALRRSLPIAHPCFFRFAASTTFSTLHRNHRSNRLLDVVYPSTFASTSSSSRNLSSVPENNISHVIGPTEPPLLQQTLGSFFDDLVSKHTESTALICRQEFTDINGLPRTSDGDCLRWTYREFNDHVDKLALGLINMGIRKGDRVGAFLLNSSAYATLQWACAKIGAILACINPAVRVPELIEILNMVECKALFFVPEIRKSKYADLILAELPEIRECSPNNIHAPAVPSLRSAVLVNNSAPDLDAQLQYRNILEGSKGLSSYTDVMSSPLSPENRQKIRSLTADTHQHECINMQFTSGTTGMPKAVALTHYNLLNNGNMIGDCMKLTSKDILCNPPPLFHCFGLVLGNLAAWTHAGTIVYASETFDPVKVLKTVSEEKCTALHGVPTMFIAELALLEMVRSGGYAEGVSGANLDFSSLRTGIAAGSPVPDEIMRQVMEKLNISELTISYGMTETSPVSFMTKTDDPVKKRTDTVGKILPHLEAKICSSEDPWGNPLPLDTPGELIVSGYSLQLGYWENEKETNKIMHTDEKGVRWLRTGDVGKLDEEGYLSIIGRYKDVIIRGGENLFPVVIENHILTMEGVDDAAVIAVPDEIYGEAVGVFVQRKKNQHGKELGIESIQNHVSNRMPQSKPTWIWFLGEDGISADFPKTLSGKIRKVELREWALTLKSKYNAENLLNGTKPLKK